MNIKSNAEEWWQYFWYADEEQYDLESDIYGVQRYIVDGDDECSGFDLYKIRFD